MAEVEKVRTKLFLAVLFIAAGVLFLFGRYLDIGMNKIWPLFIMIPVIIFAALLIDNFRKNSGFIIPTVILTFYTAYFLLMNYYPSIGYGRTWPVFVLGGPRAFRLFSCKKKFRPAVIEFDSNRRFPGIICSFIQNAGINRDLSYCSRLFVFDSITYACHEKKDLAPGLM